MRVFYFFFIFFVGSLWEILSYLPRFTLHAFLFLSLNVKSNLHSPSLSPLTITILQIHNHQTDYFPPLPPPPFPPQTPWGLSQNTFSIVRTYQYCPYLCPRSFAKRGRKKSKKNPHVLLLECFVAKYGITVHHSSK